MQLLANVVVLVGVGLELGVVLVDSLRSVTYVSQVVHEFDERVGALPLEVVPLERFDELFGVD